MLGKVTKFQSIISKALRVMDKTFGGPLEDLTKGYHPAKFQLCRLFESSFTEGSQKRHDYVMMTSFHTLEIQNLNIL